MGRHYYESEPVLVTDLKPGAVVLARRVVQTIQLGGAQAVINFDDGTSQTFELEAAPALEVVISGLR